MARRSVVTLALLALLGCSGTDDGTDDSTGVGPMRDIAVPAPTVADTIATGLNAPWSIAFLPDGDALVSERDEARILRITATGERSVVGTVPGVVPDGEGGLLGLALHDRMVYAYFTAEDDNRIVRMSYDDAGLGEPEVIFDGIPKASFHNGGRMAFGPDGMLYVGTGDAGDSDTAQDTGTVGGKILRMTPDGEPAPDNPIDDSVVYSWGHRNVQGLAFDEQGRLWASEFGQDTWDELNLVRAGDNHGWPAVEGVAEGGTGEFVDPVAQWTTDEASPSGIAIRDGVVWMAALRGERLWAIPIDGDRAGEPKDFFVGEYGRLRAVEVAPDGALWLLTNNTDGRGTPADDDDRLLRITVAS